jgi:hypothetical protein
MADNAIEKLIEETRAAYTALEAVEKELVAVESQMTAANHRRRDAKKRCDMLDLTMKKHIHENMPVVQAKMIAHEEIEQIKAADRSFTRNWSSQGASASAQGASASAQGASASAQGASASAQGASASAQGAAQSGQGSAQQAATQSAQAAINAQLANIAKCYAGKNNGSLNLSV